MRRAQPLPFRAIHVCALTLCAVFLPWSTAFLSMSEMLLVANWVAAGIAEGNGRQRWKDAFARPEPLVFMGFLGIHLLGLLWTEDLGWGADLCRILAPVLVFGAVLSGSQRLSAKELNLVLLLGAWSVIASGLFGLLFSKAQPGDYRGLSLFISHIRLALLLSMAVPILLWCWPRTVLMRVAHVAGALVALYLIVRLGSLQALAIVALMATFAIWRHAAGWGRAQRVVLRAALILLPLSAASMMAKLIGMRTAPMPTGLGARIERSAGGEPYTHDTLNTQTENGNHVWTYIAWAEMHRAWMRRSERTLNDPDDRGHPLWATAVRYLASKGLRKDSVAVMSLSMSDIHAIERGETNAQRAEQGMLRVRFEEVLFELQQYSASGQAGGHSVAMRLEFLKAGWSIARAHWVMGVGTGDTQLAFNAHYAAIGSSLDPQWRLRAHNEYLTLWISFGIFGLLAALFSWWWPARRLGAWQRPLFVCWAIAFGVSCLTDDTVETQAGATFFALYYALFVFAAPRAISAEAAPAPLLA